MSLKKGLAGAAMFTLVFSAAGSESRMAEATAKTAAHSSNRSPHSRAHLDFPHLDLEMTSGEYDFFLETMPARVKETGRSFFSRQSRFDSGTEDEMIEKWLAFGKKNLQWVDRINASRAAGEKISLSSVATQGGFPVSAPTIYNFEIIEDRWTILQALLPPALNEVIFGNAPITDTNPVTDREFIEWMRQVDTAYQQAARYKIMKPAKEELTKEAAEDVRGYLALSADAKIDEKLKSYATQNQSVQKKLGEHLVSICRNSGADAVVCDKAFRTAVSAKTLVAYKNKYLPLAKKHYDDFFAITEKRSDVVWSGADPAVMSVPFTNPGNAAVKEFLEYNIEDEYRFVDPVTGKDWHLDLTFTDASSPKTTHVVFEEGATPHVNDLGGSIITMDANQPLSEYNVQWTIRHEYGHVLGFTDCYIEFYDVGLEAFVSYQLDVTNFMCSRRGKFQPQHYLELKKAYFVN